MKKATFFIENDLYKKNNLFNENSFLNRDDTLRMYIDLKNKFLEKGIDLSTDDINPPEDSLFVIYLDFIPRSFLNKNAYLILLESDLIKPKNWNLSNHFGFRKIFTWSDDLVDEKKYFKINYPQTLKFLDKYEKRKNMFVQISSNKFSKSRNELYSFRKEIINWYERNKFNFQFYGEGWDFRLNGNRYHDFLIKKLNLNFLKSNYKNYGGVISKKSDVLNCFIFSYSLENYSGQKGYITEKIFDSFKSLTIPIYKGAINVSEKIPSNTFINYDDFDNLDELNYFLINLSEIEINQYVKNIKNFLKSKKAEQFSIEFFVNQIFNNICTQKI